MLDEGADAALVLEDVALAFTTLVDKRDLDARVEEAQLAQALGEDVVMEFDVGEYLDRRLEAEQGAALARILEALEWVQRLTQRVFLTVMAAVAPDIQPQVLGQRVDHRHTHAMQAAGNLVAVVVELAAGMQHGEDHLGRGYAFFLVNVDR